MWFDTMVARLFGWRCARCDLRWPSAAGLCSSCTTASPLWAESPAGRPIVALDTYHGAVGKRVRALKYEQQTFWAAHLGSALSCVLPERWRTAILVPVPLHAHRLAERGYNQSALLARSLAKKSLQTVDTGLLSRFRETAVQARLGGQERESNVREAFRVIATRKARIPVVLVDDVVTTGATVDACASALEGAGWDVLGVICCARGGSWPPPSSSR